MKIQPLADKIVVRRDAEVVDEKTKGGLYVPDAAKERPLFGTVVAIGSEVKARVLLTPGARVMFGKYAGAEVKIDEVEHLIMEEKDVLGIVVE